MIETVDVNDTDALDEIEARFWCFLNGFKFARAAHDRVFIIDDNQCEIEKLNGLCTLKYTRSLDACQSVMPDGWYAEHQCTQSKDTLLYFCLMKKVDTAVCIPSKQYLPTMALAWLHAIIQAMIWEIEND